MSLSPFGVAVTTVRDQLGWSIGKLSEESGVTKSQISKIESGETANPGVAIVAQICNGLKVSPNHLFSLAGLVEAKDDAPVGVAVAVDASLDRLSQVKSEVERLQVVLEGVKSGLRKPASEGNGRPATEPMKRIPVRTEPTGKFDPVRAKAANTARDPQPEKKPREKPKK